MQEQERCRESKPPLESAGHFVNASVSNRRFFPSPEIIIQASLSRTTLAGPSMIFGWANLLAETLQVS
jgi:hypothetical protein